MVARGSRPDVLCVVDTVDNQLPDVIAGQLIEDLDPLASRCHQSGHPQLREMLRDGRLRLANALGQLEDWGFTIEE